MINQVFNEDCNDTLNRMEDNSLDLVITSPPYFNAREYSQYSDIDEYMNKMKEIFEKVEDKLKPSRMCIINISPVLVERESRNKQSYRIPLPFYFVVMMESIGYEFLEDIIWKKPNGAVPNRNGGFFRNRKPVAYKPNIVTEYILVFKKRANFLIDKVLKNDSLVLGNYEKTNVWEFNPETRSNHPAPFPTELSDRCIKYYSYENDIVYDPFAGSGTVGVSCKNLNRKYILSEYNNEYCEIIKKRLDNGK